MFHIYIMCVLVALVPDISGAECPRGMFLCRDNESCIRKQWVCDEDVDCSDGSDEDHCPMTLSHLNCQSYEFSCDSGQCIHKSYRCDGDYDCADHTDEFDCIFVTEEFTNTTSYLPTTTNQDTVMRVTNFTTQAPEPDTTTTWPTTTSTTIRAPIMTSTASTTIRAPIMTSTANTKIQVPITTTTPYATNTKKSSTETTILEQNIFDCLKSKHWNEQQIQKWYGRVLNPETRTGRATRYDQDLVRGCVDIDDYYYYGVTPDGYLPNTSSPGSTQREQAIFYCLKAKRWSNLMIRRWYDRVLNPETRTGQATRYDQDLVRGCVDFDGYLYYGVTPDVYSPTISCLGRS